MLFKDCFGKTVYESETGTSKEKDYSLAYTEALNKAFVSIDALNYKYVETTAKKEIDAVPAQPVAVVNTVKEVVKAPEKMVAEVVKKEVAEADVYLYAQPVANGFQLVDTTPKVVMKVFKTSNANCFIADKEGINGVLVAKEGLWFFEYYKNDKLMSEKVAVKF